MLSILSLPFKIIGWLFSLLFGLLGAAGLVVLAIIVVCVMLALAGALGAQWTYSVFPDKED